MHFLADLLSDSFDFFPQKPYKQVKLGRHLLAEQPSASYCGSFWIKYINYSKNEQLKGGTRPSLELEYWFKLVCCYFYCCSFKHFGVQKNFEANLSSLLIYMTDWP